MTPPHRVTHRGPAAWEKYRTAGPQRVLLNQLIPEQVAAAVLDNFCEAAGITTQKTDIVNIPKILSTGTTPTDPGTTTPTTNPDDPNGGND